MTTSTWAGHTTVAADDAAPGDGAGRTALVFSGQGNQWPGMGRELLHREPVVRAVFEEADAILGTTAGWSLLGELSAPQDESRLEDPAVLQPVLVTLQIALARLLAERGVVADAFTGHSLGEIAAAAAAGALDLPGALRLAGLRGELMRRAVGTGRTALLGVDAEEAAGRIARHGGRADVAAWNAPGSTLIAGEAATVAAVVGELTAEEVFCRILPGEIAFHSRYLEPLRAEFTDAAQGIAPRATTAPLVSTVTGDVVPGEALDAAYWGDNLRRPVRFVQAVDRLLALGCRTFVEVGAHPTLSPSLADICAARGIEPLILPSLRRAEGEQESLLRTVWRLRAAGAVRAPAAGPPRAVRFLAATTGQTPRPALRGRAAQLAAAVADTALGLLPAGPAAVRFEPAAAPLPGEATLAAAPVAPGATAVAAYGRAPQGGWVRLATARPEETALVSGPAGDRSAGDRSAGPGSLVELSARCAEPGTVADTAVEAAWHGGDEVLVRLRPGTAGTRREQLDVALRVAAAALGAHTPAALHGVERHESGAAARWVHLAPAGPMSQAAPTAQAAPPNAGEAPDPAGTAVHVLDEQGGTLLRIARSTWRAKDTTDSAAAPADQATVPTEDAHTDAAPDLAALLAAGPEARLELLTGHVRRAAASVLRSGPDRVPADRPLNRLGMDSVMGLELRRRLERDFGVEIGLVRILRGATVADLAAELGEELAAAADLAADLAEAPAPGPDGGRPAPLPDLDDPADIERLLAELDALSPEEVDSLLGRLAGDAAGEI
ncbi:acyltransferase domain-containing protein [Streptomyces sp. NPDC001717]|uniref:acyltransferase domain-containing protein n=1 Tax=Streptomyces sp. NPDC001717 TaxID=3364604 RepID=UPI0036C74749